ncbi:velum formation- protein [Plenodomus lindquistii]|nr:velum formation- protein [Plenodomus lindquistii]
MSSSNGNIAVANETKSTYLRTTKDGRQIRYSLQVIQQPERARACGSGAKSSADRRPVDPPPIVELRVFENEQDITFAYNANFFLHASLENARAMAHGRAPAATPSFPVLTGTPVAGMAYLDRPTPAGYFIFPDLSVRHEGKYRLSFALFENLSEVKDLDPDDPDVIFDGNHFVTHRAEVKSAPFTVFSAKKFPGLSESTSLSRMVAEQGCRVRIRRDVRMRRRENKSSKEWDGYDDEDGGYDQARRTATPDQYGQPPNVPIDDRPRSVSNASNSSLAAARRPSADDMAQSYPPQNNYQQMPPPQSTGYSQMPSYGTANQHQYQNQYAAPPTAPVMQPPQIPASYPQQQQQQVQQHIPQQQPYGNYQSQQPMQMSQQYGHQSYQQPQYDHPPPRQPEPVHDYNHAPDYRRSSITQPPPQYPAPNQMMPAYNPMDQYSRPQQISQPVQPLQTSPQAHSANSMNNHNGHALPNLRTLQPPIGSEKLEPVSPTYHSPPGLMSGSISVNSDGSSQNYAMPKYMPQGLPPMSASTGQKRSFSSTFDTQHVNQRLTQGARPQPSGQGYSYESCESPDMEEPMDRAAMSYRRADGTQRQRHVPEAAAV